MMRAILWKEYREHRAIWLAMAAINGGVLMGLPQVEKIWGVSMRVGEELILGPVAILLAWLYGILCGAMMLAGERESATLAFLDTLPIRRRRLWSAKGWIAFLLVSGQVMVLCGWLVNFLPPAERLWMMPTYALAMLISGGVGLTYGLFFSARGEIVLNAVGMAIAGQIATLITAILLSVLILAGLAIVDAMLRARPTNIFTKDAVFVLTILMYVLLTLAAVLGSARIFSRSDRLRGPEKIETETPLKASNWASWKRLLWLSYGQMRRMILGLPLFALMLGLVLPAMGSLGWPILTLLFGVLCGVLAFADEQTSASFRFLGDQRFPLASIWIVKVGVRFLLAVFASLVLMLPSLATTIYHQMEANESVGTLPGFVGKVLHSVLVGPVVPAGIHLTIWLLYGFAIGHFCGLLFRKSIVAVVVALGLAALLLSLWIPSLLGIGLHFWQIAGVPAILIATTWLLMPAWTADRLAARGTFLRIGAALAAIGLWVAGTLWYRVVEVPDVPDRFDMPAFVASLPSMDDNKSGEAIRSVWKYTEVLMPNQDGLKQQNAQAEEALKHGWTSKRIELSIWLDKYFQGNDAKKCLESLNAAAHGPTGVVEYVKNLTVDDKFWRWFSATRFNRFLAVRGLQLQGRGDAKTFVEYLRIGLAISRNMQNLSPPSVAGQGRFAEEVWPLALDRWMEALQGSPEEVREQLKRVAAILRQHEADLPDEKAPIKAAYLIAMNSLESIPDKLLDIELPAFSREGKNESRQSEINAASLMWRIPWERERHQRILRAFFEETDPRRFRQAIDCGELIVSHAGMSSPFPPRSKRDIAALRAAQLKAALRWYQAKKGKLPKSLDALVPEYLPDIPKDPFDDQPFRYRLSDGEKIGWVEDDNAAQRQAMPGGAPGGAAGGAPGLPAPAMPGAMFDAAGMLVMPNADVFVLKVPEMLEGRGVAAAPGGPPGGPPPGPGIFDFPQIPTRSVAKGQGILWAIGEDGHDDGGVKQGKKSGTMFGEDVIFLVPPPLQ